MLRYIFVHLEELKGELNVKKSSVSGVERATASLEHQGATSLCEVLFR